MKQQATLSFMAFPLTPFGRLRFIIPVICTISLLALSLTDTPATELFTHKNDALPESEGWQIRKKEPQQAQLQPKTTKKISRSSNL